MSIQLSLFCDPPPVPPAANEAPPKMSATDNRVAPRLTLARRTDGWAIVGLTPELGPYTTRAEADDDRRGVRRFYEELQEQERRAGQRS